ncbi:hypothetical protein SLEP1_g12195 [Rubroshorea leprosula]|uniref:RNase H type-1 domain-containing protein n=1 Tax=Rubroshorea leprosula TaxID=152421 RepID=A0AAV5IJP0_9ROSI|nr:hypothetical protein SLEP1_g12195 [Rubroshorea leprosula]
MELGFEKIKAASDFVCETCMRGNILDSSRDHLQRNIPHKVCCDLRKHVTSKRQKAVATGKVKFLSMEEVLRMSSGSPKNESVPSNSIASPSQSQRRPMASKIFNPDFNPMRVKSNPNFTQSGFVKPHGHSGMQSSLKDGQQAAKTLNNSKVSEEKAPETSPKQYNCRAESVPSKCPKEVQSFSANSENTIMKAFASSTSVPCLSNTRTEKRTLVVPNDACKEQPVDALKPAKELKIFTMKIEKRKRLSRSSTSRPLSTILNSVGFSGDNFHATADPKSPDNEGKEASGIQHKLTLYWPWLPAQYATWRGSFKFINAAISDDLYGGFLAQPPCRVHCKAYELGQRIPMVIQVELLPCHHFQTDLFHNDFPDIRDIGLYFYPEDNIKRSKENYTYLFKLMEKENSVLRTDIDGVGLLIFTSNQLQEDSKDVCRWMETEFLLGVFCDVHNNYQTLQKMDNDMDADMDIDMVGHNYQILEKMEEDMDGDMDIDMVGGKTVGIADVVVSKDLLRNICGRSKKGTIGELPSQSSDDNFSTVSGHMGAPKEVLVDTLRTSAALFHGSCPLEVKTEIEVECNKPDISKELHTTFSVKKEAPLSWRPPPSSWVKLNIAGSKADTNAAAAAGGIIRDDSGQWILGFNLNIGACTRLGVELWALFHGMKLLWEKGYKKVVVESTSLQAVECVKVVPSQMDRHCALIELCRNLLKRNWNCTVNHIQPEENLCADWLAAHSDGPSMDLTVFNTPPPKLIPFL